MTVLSFMSMYILMYAMVDVFANVFPNFNQFYMAGLMASPMVLIEIFLMSAMYPNKKWNTLIIIECSGADLVLAGHQKAGGDFGPAILEIDDSSPRRSDPDV